MKKRTVLLLVLTIVICICAGYAGVCYYDVSTHTDVLLVDFDTVIQYSGNSLEEGLNPGEAVTVEISAVNQSYNPISLRETVIISVFDSDGSPKGLDGTSWMQSTFDLCDPSSGQPLLLTQPKVIQNNQLFYTSTYALDAAPQSMTLPFVSQETPEPQMIMQRIMHELCMKENAGSSFLDCIVKLDIVVEGQLADSLNSNWEILHSQSTLIGTAADSLPTELYTVSPLPTSTVCTNTFRWDVQYGYTLMVDTGSVTDADVSIPAQIRLSKQSDGFVEDPVNGDLYNVVVAGDAFYNCDRIASVTFQDGVIIKNNLMHGERGGMFQNCDYLIGVYNIPDSVEEMNGTYKDCINLVTAPDFPSAVTNIASCFEGCLSLTEVTGIPDGVTYMYRTFKNCISLLHGPQFPASADYLNECFYGCSALLDVPIMPDTITKLRNCFTGCTSLSYVPNLSNAATDLRSCFSRCESLTTAPALPTSAIDLSSCFSQCSKLTTIGIIPQGVTTMDRCFANCTSLTSAPEIPDTVTSMTYCFTGCTALSGSVTIPFIPLLEGQYDENGQLFDASSITNFLKDCSGIIKINVEFCPGFIDPDVISEIIPVEFILEHTSQGICPQCHMVNLVTEVDDLTVVIDNAPEASYLWFIEFLDNEVPDILKDGCSMITLTNDLGKHNPNFPSDTYNGFALFPSGKAYILLSRMLGRLYGMEYVIYHELAHCYDHYYSTYGRHSSSPTWRQLQETEGPTASQWYNYETYSSLDAASQRSETFAITVGNYFTIPEECQRDCPSMYEYVDELFQAYD